MASESRIANFRADSVDFLNTHILQLMNNSPLMVQVKTAQALTRMIELRFDDNNFEKGSDFIMADAKGDIVASFNTTLRKGTDLSTFLKSPTVVLSEGDFKNCDKVVKCTKPHQQIATHLRLPARHYTFGGYSKLCPIPLFQNKIAKQGYCYTTLLLSLSYFVTKEYDEAYSEIIKEVVTMIKAWPTFQEVAKVCQYIIQRVPILAPVPIPVVAVDHKKKLVHICDQRGIPTNWHQLKMGTLAELANAGAMAGNPIMEYKIGGSEGESNDELYLSGLRKVQANLRTWITKGTMMDDCSKDVALAAFLMLSPSLLSRLRHLIEDDLEFTSKVLAVNAACPNKIIVSSALRTAIQGVVVHANSTTIEKIWLGVHNILQDHLTVEGSEFEVALSKELHKLHAHLLLKKKYVLSYERKLYTDTQDRFRQDFGCSYTWADKLHCIMRTRKPNTTIGKLSISLRALDDNITHKTMEFLAYSYMCLAVNFIMFVQGAFAIMRFFFFLSLTIMGCMSITKFIFYCMKAALMRRLATNWERVAIITTIFLIYELARYIAARKEKRAIANANKGEQLQGHVKSSEKQMMAAMAMMTLAVHAFDVDLAVTMSGALNHVARLANMLTDTTAGWLVGGTGSEELQMKLFDVALEVDQSTKIEVEMEAVANSSSETFSAWINQSVIEGKDNTRPLTYGSPENVYKLNNENGLDIGESMASTNKAWSHVVGKTGSGKSTRVPLGYYNAIQHLAGRRRSILICEPTQATTQNVAAALSYFHGKEVYYKHEGKEQLGDMSIQVMTYGSAFFRSVHNPTFIDGFDAVFLDESHLITPHSLAMESLLNKHTKVRKFYLSATPRNGISCEGVQRRFEIFEHDVEKCDQDQFIAQLRKGTNVDPLRYGKKVLVFLSSKRECDRSAHSVNSTSLGIRAYSLHKDNFKTNYSKIISALEGDDEVLIFATNILETGVTMNVDVVVDFGWTNSPSLSLTNKTFLLSKRRVTAAERKQRIGRAGRLRDGHAIVIGRTIDAEELVPADVVYEAALLSFVYNLDVYINSHFDHVWVGNITKQQALTMLNFRLPSFAMKDVVFPDGSIRPELLHVLKPYTHRSTQIRTVEGCTTNHVFDSWPTIGPYCSMFGIDAQSQMYVSLAHHKVPFIFHEMHDVDLVNYAKAVQTYKPSILTMWNKPAKETANVILHVNRANIIEAISVTRSLIASAKKEIRAKIASQNLHRESPMACLFSKKTTLDLEAKIGEQIRIGERNIEKLTAFRCDLELFQNMQEMKDEELEITSASMERIGKMLELQAHTTCNEDHVKKVLQLEDLPTTSFRDAIIIGRKKAIFALSLMCIAAFGGLAWYYLWDDEEGLDNKWNKKNKKLVLADILEMKGKSFNRDKRNAAAYEHILSNDYNQDHEHNLDIFRSKKNKKVKEERTAFENLMEKKTPFVTMYDVTSDENVVSAVFMDANKQAFYETANPLANMANVKKHFEAMKDREQSKNWADMYDTDIYCNVTMRDGTTLRIRLTPHDSTATTSTGGRQGYAEKEGHYRQTGDAEVLKQPDQILEVDTRMPTNNVNLDASDMIGTVSLAEGRTNCILYKDWVIVPAHVMMCKLPIHLSFKHYTCTISEVPEAYAFPGFDLLLIRRPRTVAPVRCYATIDHARDGMTVQMLSKKGPNQKVISTVTAEAYRTKEFRWEHQIPTEVGMCGCPVFDVATGKIVGIHILGNTKKMCNTFEAFPGDAIKLLNSNDKKTSTLYLKNQLKDWKFIAEVHGHDSSKLVNLQGDFIEFKEFSRDTSRYTVENFMRSAQAGGFFVPREVSQPQKLPPTMVIAHMENKAYANGLLNSRHTYVGENPYWKQFKACTPEVEEVVREYEDHYLPSELSREAYWKDLLKYNRCCHKINPDKEALRAATAQVIKVLKESGMRSTRIMDVDEVLGDVQWSTAAGPLYGMKKKDLRERANMTMEDLVALALHCKSELKKGHNAGVWSGSLKAELRPKEKVDQHKTRVFTAAPITTLIGAKFYVDDFNKQFYGTHLKAPHTVGINKFQNGWAKVYKKLNREGWLHGSGDGSRFDSSIDPFLFDIIYTIRCHFMRDEDKREAGIAMAHMFREFVYTPIHTINGNILVKRVGNNSGQPSTVVDNTLVLMLSFYYAYAVKTRDLTFSKIDERFVFVCNGDDNKFAVSPSFVEEFGGSFSDEVAQLGLTYEFDDLTPDITRNPYMSLTMIAVGANIGFQLHPSRIVAIVQWIKKGGIVHAAQAAFAAMIESFNDPDLFVVMHKYLVWLLVTHREVLIYAMENEIGSICYMDPCQVYALHYNEASVVEQQHEQDEQESDSDMEDDEEPYLQLQMDADTLARQRAEQEEKARHEAESEGSGKDKGKQGETEELVTGGEGDKPKQGDTIDGIDGNPQGDNVGTGEDVAWTMPKLSSAIGTTVIPTVNGKKIWKRGVLKHMPKEQFSVHSGKATQAELSAWVTSVKNSLEIKEDNSWTIVLTAWCVWCANNGTSSEVDTSQKLELHHMNKVQAIPIEVFVDPAIENGGLRKIMRHFSGITTEILRKYGKMTSWGIKRGFTERAMVPYAFDYFVATPSTPKTIREQLAQAKAAAIGSGVTRKMVLDGSINSNHSSYERHMDTDADEFEHGVSGDHRPHLV